MSEANTQQNLEIKIDGKSVSCQPGETIIQAADRHGIYIPRFCYHDKLSVVANCRMCLVEVGKAPKAMPACATQVSKDMEVYTQSKKTRDAQKAVMQFLLVNHPLDCPICDQGGECDLQDIAMGFGEGESHFTGKKRAVKDEDLGPFIATEMTRCIHCTRCVRFGDEIAGLPELALTQRGGKSAISTFLKQGVHSELSGNMIDLCPVGALTSKPFRFHGRSWGYQQHEMIASHDCVGSNLYAHVNQTDEDGQTKVMRVVPKHNSEVNDQWISDIDRFSYEGIRSDDRLKHPMIKKKNTWQKVSWFEAIEFAAKGLRGVMDKSGADQIVSLMAPNSYLEEAFILQKVMRAQGVIHLDHRFRCLDGAYDAHEGLHPGLGMTLNQLQSKDHFFIVGGDLRRSQPLLNHRIRMAHLEGAQVSLLHGFDPKYNVDLAHSVLRHPSEWTVFLLELIVEALGRKKPPAVLAEVLEQVEPGDEARAFIQTMKQASSGVIVLGLEAYHHGESGLIRELAEHLAILTDCQVACVTDGSNTAGMWLAGMVPHRGAFAESIARQGDFGACIFSEPKSGYWLHQFSPKRDVIQPGRALGALENADFVVACNSFDDPDIRKVADVLLPIALPPECSGTVINAEGRWQFSRAVVDPCFEAKPAWKVYRVLGNYWNMEGMDYQSLSDLQAELEALQKCSMIPEAKAFRHHKSMSSNKKRWTILPYWLPQDQDVLVRHAQSLQQMDAGTIVYIHPDDMKALKVEDNGKLLLQQDGKQIEVECVGDFSVAAKTIVAPLVAVNELGLCYGEVDPIVEGAR